MRNKLTVADVARHFGITEDRVRHWIKRGHLRARRFGPPGKRCWYEIDEADLEKVVFPSAGRPKSKSP